MNSDAMNEDQIFQAAEDLLFEGVQPTPQAVADQLECDLADVEAVWGGWWEQLPGRLLARDVHTALTDVPDVLNQAMVRIWQHAVQEVNSRITLERRQVDLNAEEIRRAADEDVRKAQQQAFELNEMIRLEQDHVAEAQNQVRGLEAEIQVLKNSLGSETSLRKKEEQRRSNVEQELAHLRKAHDDARRLFDQRIKEEQRHAMENTVKAENDVRYFRNALEKLRDEVGKKESAMTRTIHDLQAELAKRDVKIDSARTQVKTIETDLKQQQTDNTGQSRELSRLSSQLLAETNRAKRLEDKVRQVEDELKRQRQKQVNLVNERSRRDNTLRVQLKEKEEELLKVTAKINGLERRIIAQDEEIRRLSTLKK
ncbi:MAG: DNA-binding protein [Marinobacterium sp.]|nr:DNA-binding protein [Marinobacterium sp.]